MLEHAARHCLARLTDFEGRTSREHYQPFANAVVIPVVLILAFLGLGGHSLLGGGSDVFTSSGGNSSNGFPLVVAFALVLAAIATFLLAAATVRRLHDVGKSGWWYAGLPFTGWLLMAYLRRPGDPTDNRYGPAPEEHPDPQGFRAEVERVDARIAALLDARGGAKPEPGRTAVPPTFGRRRS